MLNINDEDIIKIIGPRRITVSKFVRGLQDTWSHFGGIRQSHAEAELERRGYTVYMSHDGNGRSAVYVCQGREVHPVPPAAPTKGFVVRVHKPRGGLAYLSRFGGNPIQNAIGYARVWKTLRGATNAAAKVMAAFRAEALDMSGKP